MIHGIVSTTWLPFGGRYRDTWQQNTRADPLCENGEENQESLGSELPTRRACAT
ncbi:MAG: hypothetical protein KatS3mg111_0883 [Pirellulaceae bacterium]|nr:MAG: hypothetical protein KatS3mg111_0883 [Pirellulaceae bacterium]